MYKITGTMKKLLILFVALCLFGGSIAAQNAYTIYPVPQEQIAGKGKVTFTPSVNIVAEKGIDNYTIERLVQILKEKGIEGKVADRPKGGNSAVWLGTFTISPDRCGVPVALTG